MFSTLSSYIWSSSSEDQTVPDLSKETREQLGEDEWILVDYVNSKANTKSDEIDTVECKQRTVPESTRKSVDILEESWYVTPPSCFNASQEDSLSLQTSPLEDLLIEHPSMSVYGGPAEPWLAVEESGSEETPETAEDEATNETVVDTRTHSHRRAVRTVEKTEELAWREQKNVSQQAKKQFRKKKLKMQNETHTRKTRSRRKQKKMDRKQGKHSTVYSNRGC